MTSADALFCRLLEMVSGQGALMDDSVAPEERIKIELTYPRLFAQLVRDHLFIAFDLGDIRVFSNLLCEDDNLESLLRDRHLVPPLITAGFLPFARPAGGSYDPICFDVRGLAQPADAPIVQMDHESILTHFQIPNPQPIAAGILELPMYWGQDSWVSVPPKT